MSEAPFDTPPWCKALLADVPAPASPERLMRLAIDVARASVEHDGGPFGAVIATSDGNVVDVGWNRVITTCDSTAHAEIVAIRRAQRFLGSHALTGLVLYASCAPCIQCFGAIYWSGLVRVVSCATKEDAEALGFAEGPMSGDLWARAQADKGLVHEPRFFRDEAALAPLREYVRRERPVY